jgi:hypothetical protein
MSPFWRNFQNNSKARHAPVNELRETMTEVCEDFARIDMPIGYKRNVLLKELHRLVEFYRDSGNWPKVGETFSGETAE